MYRSVLALLFAAVLLLSGCAAGQQTVPKEKSEQEANMDGAALPMRQGRLYGFHTVLQPGRGKGANRS